MNRDSPAFQELFSALTNSLQTALLIAGQRATAARTATAESDQLYAAVSTAAEAARQLRTDDKKGGV